MKTSRLLTSIAASALLLAGCSSSTPSSGPSSTTGSSGKKLNVVVAFYPLQYVAESILGDQATVTSLVAPGTEPHDVELGPKQIAALGAADLVIYQKGFQSQVDKAIEQEKPRNVIDTTSLVTMLKADEGEHHHGETEGGKTEGEEHENHPENGLDPHVWLDPSNMSSITKSVGEKLVSLEGVDQAAIKSSTDEAVKKLDGLDADYKASLATCKRRDIIVSHQAFGYMAKRYNLNQIGISGLSPDAEPSPARIAEVHEEARAHGITTVFYETLASPTVAKSIAGDLGLKVDVLDPVEGVTPDSRGKNYVEIMQSNLTALKTANECV